MCWRIIVRAYHHCKTHREEEKCCETLGRADHYDNACIHLEENLIESVCPL